MQTETFSVHFYCPHCLTGKTMDNDSDGSESESESEGGDDDDDGGMKVLTWLSAERRGMERVRPCPSIGW